MERRVFALLAAALLTGCLGIQLPFLGGEPNLVPSKADFVLTLRIGDIVSDPDILKLLNKSGTEFEAELRQAESETGIDARKVGKLIIFGRTRAGQPYTGTIASGQIDQQAFVSKARAGKAVVEQTYQGYTIYVEPKPPGNVFAFIDGVLVSGTREAVQDVIDVKRGAARPFDSEQANEAADRVDRNAKAFLIMLGEAAPAAPIPGTQGLPAQAIALSLDKQGGSVAIKAAVLANDSAAASRAFNSINGGVSLLRALSEPGSARERFLNQIRVEAQGNFVLVDIATTVADLEAFGGDMARRPAAPTPSPQAR
ncbi:MAG: hypothetical protein QXH27_00115 [Candidatus Micrarchaeia archaeon]